MSYPTPRQQLLAAAQAGNITALRAVREISAADATTALSLVMPILLFHPLVQQSPQLLRGYAECAKNLIDAGADARAMVLRHSGDERVDCRRTYLQLCRTAQDAEATPCDAELVALLMHVVMYHFPVGPTSRDIASRGLRPPVAWRRTMTGLGQIITGPNAR